MATGLKRKKNGFTQINNSMFEDSRLSWKAKGLLGYMLSRPDGWQIREVDLIKRSSGGRDSVRSAIKELEKFGYLYKYQPRVNGKLADSIWHYDDEPSFETPMSETPISKIPMSEIPTSETSLHNNKDFNNKNFNNKKSNNTELKRKDIGELNSPPSETDFVVDEVIRYLNLKTNKNFKQTTKEYRKLIGARIKNGATIEQIKHVIDLKVLEWGKDEKMKQYLNPKTLFAESNFDRYLNQEMPKQKERTLRDIALEGNVDLASFLRGES